MAPHPTPGRRQNRRPHVVMWPAITRVLADYGLPWYAGVDPRLDARRTIADLSRRQHGWKNPAVSNLNAQNGITLDLTSAAVARRLDLVRWADVVTESFTPDVMRTLRLDYESLRQVKPDIIMLSTCLMGQTGPLAQFAGFGNLAAAFGGFFSLAGWPDRPPAGPYGAYTDYVAPRFAAAAILAALEYRRRTGQGQYLDQSQAESALHFLAPAVLDYTVNRRSQHAAGNDDPQQAPHGVYLAAGADRPGAPCPGRARRLPRSNRWRCRESRSRGLQRG